VCQKHVSDVDELKQRLVKVWTNFGQTIIDEASMSGGSDFRPASTCRDTTVNICCESDVNIDDIF